MKTMYVIKNTEQIYPSYYLETEKRIINGSLVLIKKSSAIIKGATFYNSYEEALNEINENKLSEFKPYPICPMCHKDYDWYPAISRSDNKTEICPDCGVKEAINDFLINS